jgi:hypothetical protein
MANITFIEKLRTSLILADIEFRFQYARYWNLYWDKPDYQWHLEVRQQCKEYGERALLVVDGGDINLAIEYLTQAKELEGEFCKWLDDRVYNLPLELLMSSSQVRHCTYCSTHQGWEHRCKFCYGSGLETYIDEKYICVNSIRSVCGDELV